MTTCDRDCIACPHVDVCRMQAAYDYRAEVYAEQQAEHPAPAQIRSCDKHADLERRVEHLEDVLSRVLREMNMGREP